MFRLPKDIAEIIGNNKRIITDNITLISCFFICELLNLTIFLNKVDITDIDKLIAIPISTIPILCGHDVLKQYKNSDIAINKPDTVTINHLYLQFHLISFGLSSVSTIYFGHIEDLGYFH